MDIPLELAGLAAAPLLTAITVLWRHGAAVKKDCDAQCRTQLAEKNETIATLKLEHSEAMAAQKAEWAEVVAKLEGRAEEYRGLWVKEMEHATNMALLPRRPNEPPPDSLPPPEWDEPTEVGKTREQIQRAILGQRRREFEASSSNMRAVAPPEILRRGMRKHPLVERVQAFLAGQNLYRDPVDGDFSAETEAAVRHFQDVAGLSVTGIVDTQTWGALLAAGFKMPNGSRPKMPSRPR